MTRGGESEALIWSSPLISSLGSMTGRVVSLIALVAVITVLAMQSVAAVDPTTSIQADQELKVLNVALSSDNTIFTITMSQVASGFGLSLQRSHFSLIGNASGTISLASATLTGPSFDSNSLPTYQLQLASALAPSSGGEVFVLRFQPPGPPAVCSPVLTLTTSASSVAVVGNGFPASCNEDALRATLASATSGSLIKFNCGALPVSILLSQHIILLEKDFTIDGENLITLEAFQSRIFIIDQWTNYATPLIKLQRITLKGGVWKTPYTSNHISGDIGGGGAILANGGTLSLIQVTFVDNLGNPGPQPDAGGGAVYLLGTNALGTHTGTTTMESCSFFSNQASNGGAIGSLGTNMTLNNLLIAGNLASGTGGNPGNGGNGGAVVMDGPDNSADMCGILASANVANTYGKAFFRVGYDDSHSPPSLHVGVASSMLYMNRGASGGFATIYAQDISFSLTDSLLASNSAPLFGGLWFSDYIVSSVHTRGLVVDGVEFHNNTAQDPNRITGAMVLNWGDSVNPVSIQVRNTVVSGSNGYNAVSIKAANSGVSIQNSAISTTGNTGACSASLGTCSAVSQFSNSGECCSPSAPHGDPQLGTLAYNGCRYPTRAIGNSTVASLVSKASCSVSGGSAKFSSVLMNSNTGAVARPADFYIAFSSSTSAASIHVCLRAGSLCGSDGQSCSSDSDCTSFTCSQVNQQCCSGASCPAPPTGNATRLASTLWLSLSVILLWTSLAM